MTVGKPYHRFLYRICAVFFLPFLVYVGTGYFYGIGAGFPEIPPLVRFLLAVAAVALVGHLVLHSAAAFVALGGGVPSGCTEELGQLTELEWLVSGAVLGERPGVRACLAAPVRRAIDRAGEYRRHRNDADAATSGRKHPTSSPVL
jgi:hypothetical protein